MYATQYFGLYSYLGLLVYLLFLSMRVHGKCNVFEWKCRNGQCIDSGANCDGVVDCSDRSDETAETCLYNRCPNFTYRCAYGACVDGEAECNGVKDCADNSDELPILCNKSVSGTKDPDSFTCDSGQVISLDNSCNGKRNCKDGSDELLKNCGSVNCPSSSYQCAYGACVDGNAKCNGVADCADGSDEYKSLCGPPQIPIQPVSGCRVENIPGLVVVYESDPNTIINPGGVAGQYTSILYKCHPKHVLIGRERNFCDGSKWIEDHPQCQKYCSSAAIKGVSITTRCELDGAAISCDQALRRGTRAVIGCAPGYRKPSGASIQEVLVCDSDGEWDYHPFRCIQECGKEYNPGTPFIIGGDVVNNTRVPWHVGIYFNKRGFYGQICGGTILNAKLVVSAAHCFWDARKNTPFDKSFFAVAAGKFYRNYYEEEPLQAQFFNLSELIIHRGYKDISLQYSDDIAVLVLNNYIIFQQHIRPICMEWNLKYREKEVKPNSLGRVAGWGKVAADGGPSPVLRVLDTPSVSYDDCVRQTNPVYKVLVTGDKFCAGGVKGETVCSGDSGGGFAIPKNIDGIQTYYLWGIVSNALTSAGSCSGTFYTAFTNVHYYVDMLLDYETKYRPK